MRKRKQKFFRRFNMFVIGNTPGSWFEHWKAVVVEMRYDAQCKQGKKTVYR